MEPILTLPYSEWLVAEQFMKALPSSQGYSMYAPLSRQEKGVDLLLTCRPQGGTTHTAALQVKYSRAYEKRPGSPYQFEAWFRSFPVSERTDFVVLASLYPHLTGKGGGTASSWWLPMMLIFRRRELSDLLSSLATRSGKAERMFYLGFDTPDKVSLTRGTPTRRDLSEFAFRMRLPDVKRFLGPAQPVVPADAPKAVRR